MKKNTNINSPKARRRHTEKFPKGKKISSGNFPGKNPKDFFLRAKKYSPNIFSPLIFPGSQNRVKISAKVRDIIHGYIMSDGYVDPLGRLTVDQGKEQANFVEWLYHELEPIRTNYPISNVRRTRKSKTRGPINTYSRRFFSKAVLKGFRHMWYKPYTDEHGVVKFRKSLPNSLPCFFNSTFLTLWFAGDGTKTIGHKGAKFEVTNYLPEERQTLKKLFQQKFGLSVNIIRSGISSRGNTQWAIVLSAQDYPKFRSLITEMDLIPKYFPQKLHKKT
jgi:hypothetical protein